MNQIQHDQIDTRMPIFAACESHKPKIGNYDLTNLLRMDQNNEKSIKESVFLKEVRDAPLSQSCRFFLNVQNAVAPPPSF